MFEIRGKITSDYQTSYENCQILVLFFKEDGAGGWTPDRATFPVEPSGSFTLSLPVERVQLMNALTLQVQGPDGVMLASKSYLIKDGEAGQTLFNDGSGDQVELEIKVGFKSALTIKGNLYRQDKIEPLPEEIEYAQHQVVTLYSQLDAATQKWVLVKADPVDVQPNGDFTLSLPDKDSRGNAITLEVHAPGGALLATKHYLIEGPREGKVTIKGLETDAIEYSVEQLEQEPVLRIPVNPQPLKDELVIKGQLVRDKASTDQSQQDSECQYEGHKIVASYELSQAGADKQEPKTFEVERNGQFILSLPDIKQPFEFKVVAPDNEALFSRDYYVKEIKGKFLLVESEAQAGDPKNEIEIQPKNYFEIQRSDDPFLDKFSARRSFKLTGAVFDLTGKHTIANRQVLLWGRLNGVADNQFSLVLATRTDPQGYFSGDYPLQLRYQPHSFVEAYGLVGLGKGKRVPIPLENGHLPEKVILVVEVAEGEIDPEDDCNCHAMVPRAPDHIDFANSGGTYSTDLEGDACVNFNTPNRTLEEFSFYSVVRTTDPEIIYGPGNPNLPPTSMLNKNQLIERRRLDAKSWIDWDQTPTTYQATTIAHGHLLHFKQTWKADGYSLGDLLYSLPLAPCQKKQIAIVDWDRSERAARAETAQETERLSAALVHDRDISEIVDLTLTEEMKGGSKAKSGGFGGGLGLAFIDKGIGGLLGISGGASKSSSTAWQNSSRHLATNSLHQLRDATMQSASAVRTQRTTVVQTVRQGEDMRVETEVVANHNHCHAITMEYFEVLRHFLITQELVDVQECLFIPLLINNFDRNKALRWREPLQQYLRDHRLGRGFEAMERRANNYKAEDFPTGRYSQDRIEYLEGELYLTFRLARPVDSADGFIITAWGWVPLLGLLDDAQEFYNNYLKDQSQKDEIFRKLWGPRIAARILERLRFAAVNEHGHSVNLPIDTTLISNYQHNKPLRVNLRPGKNWPSIRREDISRIQLMVAVESDTSPIDILPSNSEVIVQSGTMHYRTKFMAHPLFSNTRIGDDLKEKDGTFIYTPLSQRELRDPRKEDEELELQLLSHLNEHLEYYHKIIWWTMDKDRRYMMLDGFKAPNSKNRSVASVVENRLIGIVGNSLVMPVAPGYKLDPTYCQREADDPVDLLHLYAPTTPIDPIRVSVPTRGVFAEAVMGSCNSCETKDDTRFWRFEESPCGDEPTAIQPVSVESRRAEPGDLQAKDFPAPMINLQNAPAAPDPTGLAAALQLLGTPNIFRDITGLDQNQKNALAALTASLDAAKFFGAEAGKLLLQKQLSGDIDKTMQSIEKAKGKNLITDEQARDLTNTALRGAVGSGAAPQQPNLTDQPEVQKLLTAASKDPNSEVDLQRDKESVNIRRGGGSSTGNLFDFTVAGIVPDIRQPSPNTCWATAAAIMLSWKGLTSITPEVAAQRGGKAPDDQNYRVKFRNDEALSEHHQAHFTETLGMVVEPPMSQDTWSILSLLKTHGPLWILNDETPSDPNSNHFRIIYGIYGDGEPDDTFVRIMDPWSGPVNERFTVFQAKYERPAWEANQLHLPFLIQIAHF